MAHWYPLIVSLKVSVEPVAVNRRLWICCEWFIWVVKGGRCKR